jgi:hypothetical protein
VRVELQRRQIGSWSVVSADSRTARLSEAAEAAVGY